MPPGRLGLPEDAAEDLLGATLRRSASPWHQEERCLRPCAELSSGARPTVLLAVGGGARAACPRGTQCIAGPNFGDGGFLPSAVLVSPSCFPFGAIVSQTGPGAWLALAPCGRGSLARPCESRGVFSSSWQPLPDEQEQLW